MTYVEAQEYATISWRCIAPPSSWLKFLIALCRLVPVVGSSTLHNAQFRDTNDQFSNKLIQGKCHHVHASPKLVTYSKYCTNDTNLEKLSRARKNESIIHLSLSLSRAVALIFPASIIIRLAPPSPPPLPLRRAERERERPQRRPRIRAPSSPNEGVSTFQLV